MTTLREAVLILPKSRPCVVAGDYSRVESNWTTRALICHRLVKAFGGFTVAEGEGHWLDADDGNVIDLVWIITVAVPDTPESVAFLRLCALFANEHGRQFSTYLRLPDGTVELVE